MPVSYDEYYNQLVDQSAFNICAMVGVLDTDYEYFASDDFRVRKPDIRIEVGGVEYARNEWCYHSTGIKRH